MTNVLIWNEFRHERLREDIKQVYPDGIHGVLEGFLAAEADLRVACATLDEPECGLTRERVDAADVIIWWGHSAHGEVPDAIAERVTESVLKGCGLIALHSAHESKPFKRLMGTACNLRWRANDRERVFAIAQHHPICRGIPEYFEIPNEEMYGEKFDVPNPTEVIFISWFAGGEVFRSGLTYERGYGKIFYFRPGHEEYPTYKIPEVQTVIKNAVHWAARTNARSGLTSPEPAVPPESLLK